MSYRYISWSSCIIILMALALILSTWCSKLRNPLNRSGHSCEACECHKATPIAHYPPKSGKHTRHLNSDIENISCSDCHNNYNTDILHKNGIMNGYNSLIQAQAAGNIVYFNETDTDAFWNNDNGTCNSLGCHYNLLNIEWYGNNDNCLKCHKSSIGSRGQIVDSNGDGTGTGGEFNKNYHHVIDYGNRTTQIVTSSDCRVCHDQSRHMGRTVRLRDKDTDEVIVYDPSEPASINSFCISCHDSDGATIESNPLLPFSSVNSLGAITTINWVDGDMHGGSAARDATYNKGTIKSPYDDASLQNYILACTACHKTHGSSNAFILETTVNSVAITTVVNEINDNGGWTEFCEACHNVTIISNGNPCVDIPPNHGSPEWPDTKPCQTCHKHNSYICGGGNWSF